MCSITNLFAFADSFVLLCVQSQIYLLLLIRLCFYLHLIELICFLKVRQMYAIDRKKANTHKKKEIRKDFKEMQTKKKTQFIIGFLKDGKTIL